MGWRNSFEAEVASAMQALINADLNTSAVLKFFDGAMPALCSDADVGTVVATNPMNPTPFLTASGNVINANTVTDDTSTNAGTVQYFRMYDSVGACYLQGSAGDVGTEDFVFSNATFGSGDTCIVHSMTINVALIPLS